MQPLRASCYYIDDMHFLKLIVATPCLLLLSACDLFDVHPYDGKVDGETGLNAKHIAQIEQALEGDTTFRFAVISDTQRWDDDTEDEVESINARGDVDFVVHCGDITDFGITKEFEWQRDILNKLNMPYVLIIGNHDTLGSGREVWRTMFGPENFAFIAGNTRFICLDTNALEYDFDLSIPDFSFIESYIGDSLCANTVVCMHAGPYSEQFDNNVAKPFEAYIMQLNHPIFCLYGHSHSTSVNDFFGDGLLYYQICSANKRQYYVFTINGTNYSYETIDY